MKNAILTIILFSLSILSGFAKTSFETAFQVKIIGKGQPILFIPDATCSGDEWNATEPLNQPPYLPIFASLIDRQEIEAIKIPVMVLAAFQSMPQNPGFTSEYVRDIFTQQYSQCKTCKISICPSAKHFINYDAPEWLWSEIDTFIGKS